MFIDLEATKPEAESLAGRIRKESSFTANIIAGTANGGYLNAREKNAERQGTRVAPHCLRVTAAATDYQNAQQRTEHLRGIVRSFSRNGRQSFIAFSGIYDWKGNLLDYKRD